MRTFAIITAFVATSCSQQAALLADTRKPGMVRSLERELARSVETEKLAVLASSDEESEKFANESRKAASEVDRLRGELREIATAAEKEKLDAFDAAWAKMSAIDAKLLQLATANTNLKATRLSTHEAAAALDTVLAALDAAAAATKDGAQQRDLHGAGLAALRIQALHAAHIASPDDEEMTGLEARMKDFEQRVDAALASKKLPKAAAEALAKGAPAWVEYKALTTKLLALSRANANLHSIEMSLHEKRDASTACERALQALTDEILLAPRATR